MQFFDLSLKIQCFAGFILTGTTFSHLLSLLPLQVKKRITIAKTFERQDFQAAAEYLTLSAC
jgi:hypothetical protein